EQRVDEGGGVADEEQPIAAKGGAAVGPVAGRLDGTDTARAREQARHLALRGERLVEDLGRRMTAARARVRLLEDGADGGHLAAERDEPPPAAVEHDEREVALVVAALALAAGVMREAGDVGVDRGVGELEVAAAGGERVAPGGVDEDACALDVSRL